MIKSLIILVFLPVYLYSQINWQKLSPLPDNPRSGFGSFFLKNNYYVLGGGDSILNVQSNFWAYNPDSNIWRKRNDPPFSRGDASGISSFNYGYIIDGADDMYNFTKKCWRYECTNDRWSEIDSTPAFRRFSTAFTYRSNLFTCAGWDSVYNCTNSLWKYDLQRTHWYTMSELPSFGRQESSISVSDSFAYLVGGRINNKTINQIWRYNISSDTWDSLPPIPNDSGRAISAVYSFKNILIVAFGYYQDANRNMLYVPQTSIYKFDLNTLQWSLITYNHVLTPGGGTGFFQNGTKCYLFGGIRNLSNSAFGDMWMFDAAALGAEVDSTSTGVGDPELSSDFKIFPNPLREGQKLSVICRESGELTLYSVLGQEVHKSQVNAGLTTIDMITLSNQRELLFYKVVYDKGGNQSGKISLLKQ